MPPKRKRGNASKETVNNEEEELPKTSKGSKAKKDTEDVTENITERTTRTRNREPKKIIEDNSASESESVEEEKPAKRAKATKKAVSKKAGDTTEKKTRGRKKPDEGNSTAAAPKNKTATTYGGIDFTCTRQNESGKDWNFKISNWNVDGLRAWVKKGGLEYIQHEKPDVFCIQETKCSEDKIPVEAKEVPDYKVFWHCSSKEGYAGVGLYSKTEPLSVKYGLGIEEHDDEGRMITAEYDEFYVISVYVPNAGRGLVTLPKRLKWNEAFRNYIGDLDGKKPVIVCGDMNVAHLEIDLSNPTKNTKNAGFTKEERDGMTEFLSDGYIDTFRKLYPDKTQAYTFWTYMSNCRAKNIGWRLDYFIVSERLMDSVCDNVIRSEVFGSDHCPITLFLNL